MIHFLTNFRDFLWGAPSLFLLGGYGIFITIKSRFYPIVAFGDLFQTIKSMKNDKKGISPLMSLSTALGGTVGIGSIIGVAYAIQTGGVGVVFWMWISGFIGMMTKFSECALAVKHRIPKNDYFIGGTSYILKNCGYYKVAILFSILCILASFGTGNLTQINGLSQMLIQRGYSYKAISIFAFILIFIVTLKGQKFIGKANEIIMPCASLIYLGLTSYILLINLKYLPNALTEIISQAFGIRSIGCGISLNILTRSFRIGFSKGVFSHEAGMGTSPIAHASSNDATPFSQGLLGLFEVFFDTFIVGTMTALTLIVSGETNVYNIFLLYFGKIGADIFSILLILFVFAAMISWCFYAESCLYFLFRKEWAAKIYRILFSLCTVIGVLMSVNYVWVISDILNILMIIPNIFILVLKNNEIINIIDQGKSRTLIFPFSIITNKFKRGRIDERGKNYTRRISK